MTTHVDITWQKKKTYMYSRECKLRQNQLQSPAASVFLQSTQ